MSYDAIIIGGGPSGSTCASRLALRGRRVLILEREPFPRYHVGESLIPYVYVALQEIGALEKVENAGFQRKPGFQFVTRSGKLTKPYYFNASIRDRRMRTWQVDRARFDEILLDHAVSCGADLIDGVSVSAALVEDDRVVGVRYLSQDGVATEERAPCVVDASGRAGLLARQFSLRQRDPRLDQVAVWRYSEGARRQPGDDEGNIVVMVQPHGWFWWLPLAGDVTSIGLVTSARYLKSMQTTLPDLFDSSVAGCDILAEWTADGRWQAGYRTEGDYTYSADAFSGNGFVLIGDAAAFIDPVFSSGVWLGMMTAIMAADAIDDGIPSGGVCPAGAFAEYDVLFRRAESTFRHLIDAFYDERFSAGQMFRAHPEMVHEMGRVLQGDVFDDNRSFNRFLIDYRSELARDAAERTQDIYDHGEANPEEQSTARIRPTFDLRAMRLEPLDEHAELRPTATE